jgi:hypothetical protein
MLCIYAFLNVTSENVRPTLAACQCLSNAARMFAYCCPSTGLQSVDGGILNAAACMWSLAAQLRQPGENDTSPAHGASIYTHLTLNSSIELNGLKMVVMRDLHIDSTSRWQHLSVRVCQGTCRMY